jgi:hypothetical protein
LSAGQENLATTQGEGIGGAEALTQNRPLAFG